MRTARAVCCPAAARFAGRPAITCVGVLEVYRRGGRSADARSVDGVQVQGCAEDTVLKKFYKRFQIFRHIKLAARH